jgi:hypothetical protein
MAIYLDTKFINLISPRLERFHWKKSNLATCRCPVCGDSTKSRSKTRFYFYEKGGHYFVRCHNCDFGTTLGNFIRKLDESLYRQYCFETLADQKELQPQLPKSEPKPRLKKAEVLEDIPTLSELPKDHAAVRWADTRRIPDDRRSLLYYTDNFFEVVSRIDPEASVGDDARILIPVFNPDGTLAGLQGRILKSTNQNREIRYITIKADKDAPRMWYGLERVKADRPIVVVEGPIDSLFLRNGIAMMGLSDPLGVPEGIPVDKLVYALDNEPRNPQVVEAMMKLIDAGRCVCVWDHQVKGMKDINDMAMRNKRAVEIESMIKTCTYHGLAGRLAVSRWSRV